MKYKLLIPLTISLIIQTSSILSQKIPDQEEILGNYKYKNVTVDTIFTKASDSLIFVKQILPNQIIKSDIDIPAFQKLEAPIDPQLYEIRKVKTELKRRVIESNSKPNERQSPSEKIIEPDPKQSLPQCCGFPPDGTVAVSLTGHVVAADNSGISFFDDKGLLGSFNYLDFFGFTPEDAIMDTFDFGDGVIFYTAGNFLLCDPKVIFDPEENKFVFILQAGASPKTSQLHVLFSRSDNPMEGWNYYKFHFWPEDLWIDHCRISVNYNEVVIAGALFRRNHNSIFAPNMDSYEKNKIYMFDKDQGYNQQHTIHGVNWNIIPRGNIIPVPAARDRMYGPGTYLLFTETSQSDTLGILKINGHLSSDPDLIRYAGLNITPYTASGAAFQPDTFLLDPGDCRISSAYYQRGKLYFVFSKDDGQGFSGISYNRVRLSDLHYKSKFFHDNQNSDYCYPAITNRLGNERYSRAVLAYLRSGPNTYPQIRIRYLRGNMSAKRRSTTVQLGHWSNFGAASGEEARWGDYIGIQKRYGTDYAWLIGHIANSDHIWRSHLIRVSLP